jgi:hypothetical protein
MGAVYCIRQMTDCQSTNAVKTPKSPATKLIAAAIFLGIACVFVLLRLGEKGTLQFRYVFGVCGFKQRFGLPCPGCGWTRAAQAFAAGDVIRSLQIQPAAAVFCGVAVLAAILALHTAIFGIHSRLQQVLLRPCFWKYVIVGACVVILLGWLVTLAKTLSGNGGP